MAFDVPAALPGLTVDGVASVELRAYCAALTSSGGTVTLQSATGASGWGPTLDATFADFTSTNTYIEDSLLVNSTGTKTFAVDKAHLDYSGITYFRMLFSAEGSISPYYDGCLWVSADNGTNQPVLVITLLDLTVIYVPIMARAAANTTDGKAFPGSSSGAASQNSMAAAASKATVRGTSGKYLTAGAASRNITLGVSKE
jgi:hypothetical protein